MSFILMTLRLIKQWCCQKKLDANHAYELNGLSNTGGNILDLS